MDNRTVMDERPLTGVRRIIGERMKESLMRSPQATGATRIDVSGINIARKRMAQEGRKVSYTALLVKLISEALKKHPELNASRVENKILYYSSINIGIAMAIGDLLFVPVIKNVQDKDLETLTEEIQVMAERIKTGQIDMSDFEGGTFTLSNLGMHDIEMMTPILNAPEAGILAIGKAKKEYVFDEEDNCQIKPLAMFSITIDHAVMDGLHSVMFLKTVKELIKELETNNF